MKRTQQRRAFPPNPSARLSKLSNVINPEAERNRLIDKGGELSLDDIHLVNEIDLLAPELDPAPLRGFGLSGRFLNQDASSNRVGERVQEFDPSKYSFDSEINRNRVADAFGDLFRQSIGEQFLNRYSITDPNAVSSLSGNEIQRQENRSETLAPTKTTSLSSTANDRRTDLSRQRSVQTDDALAPNSTRAAQKDRNNANKSLCFDFERQIKGYHLHIDSLQKQEIQAGRDANELFAEAEKLRDAADQEMVDTGNQMKIQIIFRRWNDAAQDGLLGLSKWSLEQQRITKSGIEERAIALHKYSRELNKQKRQLQEELTAVKELCRAKGCERCA